MNQEKPATESNGVDPSVAVIGMGYVGLPLAIRFTSVGRRVLALDIDQQKVDLLNRGKSYIKHIGDDAVTLSRDQGLQASTDFSLLKQYDAIVICVPTPLNKYREPDLSFVVSTIDAVIPHLRNGHIVSLESTTYPGTTEEELMPRIERAGWRVGEDVFLVYSPEREDPGNAHFETRTIPKIVGGSTPKCLEAGLSLYKDAIEKLVPVSSTGAAEMTKILENIHRAVNIGLVNEMKIIADRMGLDIHEIIRAAATKPFGFVPYFPGPGLGGHCIPIDPFYLTWKAREYGVHTRFIELAGEVNSSMPAWVFQKLSDALNDRAKSVRGSRVLVMGVAYKKNVDDMRESPAVILIEMLRDKGACVDYFDPWVPTMPTMREHNLNMKSIEISDEIMASYDAVLIATDHDSLPYKKILKNARLVVDSRGRYQEDHPNLVRA